MKRRLRLALRRSGLLDRAIQRKGKHRVAGGYQYVLFAIDCIRNGAGARCTCQSRMPQDFAFCRVERNQVGSVAGKQQVAGGAQHGHNAVAARPIVTPYNFAGFVIERNQRVT